MPTTDTSLKLIAADAIAGLNRSSIKAMEQAGRDRYGYRIVADGKDG